MVELNLEGLTEYSSIATIRDLTVADVPEGLALLALDLAELQNLGIRRGTSPNKPFQRAVNQLAKRLNADQRLSSAAQLKELLTASAARQENHVVWREHSHNPAPSLNPRSGEVLLHEQQPGGHPPVTT